METVIENEVEQIEPVRMTTFYYTKSEVNRMLEAVEREKRELFSEYEQMQQEIDDLKIENENLKERNKMLRGILVDALKG